MGQFLTDPNMLSQFAQAWQSLGGPALTGTTQSNPTLMSALNQGNTPQALNNQMINTQIAQLPMNPGIQGSGRGAETGIAGEINPYVDMLAMNANPAQTAGTGGTTGTVASGTAGSKLPSAASLFGALSGGSTTG